MRNTVLLTFGLFFSVAAGSTVSAQRADSVWYLHWERYTESIDGDRNTISHQEMWIGDDRARTRVNQDRFVSIVGDSIYVIDSFQSNYTTGPVDKMEYIWADPTLLRHRDTGPPFSIRETHRRDEVLGYDVREWQATLAANRRFIPMRQRLLVTDQLPLADSLLPMFYVARSLVGSDLSLDLLRIDDTLEMRGLIPVMSHLRVEVPSDTAVWLVTELKEIRRVAVPKDFFLPPAEYAYKELTLPSEDEMWILRAIPMPGGPREAGRRP